MRMDKIWELVMAVIAGLGGIGAIFCAVIYFASNFIAERLQKKFMIPQGLVMVPADKELKRKVDEEHYNAARGAVVVAQDELNSNAPFIPEKFYEAYEEIRKLCGMQLSEFEERWNVGYLVSQEEKESLSSEAYKRTGEINAKFKQLNNEIREYLSNLDVLE